jgi:hypothetical protein
MGNVAGAGVPSPQTNMLPPSTPTLPTMGMGNSMNTNPTPSLKRDRPVDDMPGPGEMNAMKRRNTGSGMPDGLMPPPVSTSPTNPRPASAASNHSQIHNPMSMSPPSISAGPTMTNPHMSPPSSVNGLPTSISAPNISARSTPTPGPMSQPPHTPSASASPRQNSTALSESQLVEAQAAAQNRDRMRQQQIREAQMRAAREQQQKQQMARQMSGNNPGMAGANNGMGMGAPGGGDGTSGPGPGMGGHMGMNGMGGVNGPAVLGSSSNITSEVQRQLIGVLHTPNHPFLQYMHRNVPGFGQMPVQQQMQKMMMAQVGD